jgi:hypothetical protein
MTEKIDHELTVGSFNRPRHRKGTYVTCTCGWRAETPIAPSAGGTGDMRDAHRHHVHDERMAGR